MPESITTRRLQMARRSAQKKPKSRAKSIETKSNSVQCGNYQTGKQLIHSVGTEFDVVQMSCFSATLGWNLHPLRRIWSFGFKFEAIASILKQMPFSVQSCVQQSFRTWEKITQENGTHTLKHTFGSWFDIERTADEFLQQSVFLVNHPEHSAESSYAFLKMTFDPETQLRTNFTSNRAAAVMFGMSESELQSRLASYDLELPFSALDTVCVFLHLLLRDLAVPSVVRVKYLRFDTGTVGSGRYRLICWSTLSITDDSGRVVEVGFV